MTYTTAGFICLLIFFLSLRGYESRALEKHSILGTIINDTEICPTPHNLLTSQYFKRCAELPYPTGDLKWNSNNSDVFLCLALYDRSSQICHGASLSTENTKFSLLHNKTIFDTAMNNTIQKERPSDTLNICELIGKSPHISLYEKTQKYVAQLANPKVCVESCYQDMPKTLNDLCLAIHLIDEQLVSMNVTRIQSSTVAQTNNQINPIARSEQEKLKVHDPPAAKSVSGPEKQTVEKPITKNNVPVKVNEKKNLMEDSPRETKKTMSISTGFADISSESVSPQSPNIENTKKKELTQKVSNDSTQKVLPPSGKEQDHKTVLENSQETPIVVEKTPTDQDKPVVEENEKGVTVSDNTQELSNSQQNYGEDPYRGEAQDVMAGSPDMDLPVRGDDDTQVDPESFGQSEKIAPLKLNIDDEADSHFFSYFTGFGIICIIGCLVYHRKQKIMAMLLEGRRSRGGRGRRRPSTANYRKLDCNLEEAVNSQCSSNVTHVIY